MERENISVDIIAVHGHGHVVVISGMVFELEPGMSDPAIRKIEWAAGQGAFVGKMAGKIRYSGTMATKCISPRRLRRSVRSRGGSRTMWPSLTPNTARRPVPRLGGGPVCWSRSAKSRKNGPFHASDPCGAARRKKTIAKTCTISFGCVLGRVVS